MGYISAFAYIIYMVYLVAFLAILAGAIYLARGDVARGKKYIGGAVFVSILVVILPHALDYILGPSFAVPSGGNFDAYANFIYPYPDCAEQHGNDVTLTYSHPMKATVSMIIIRLNFSTPSGSSAYWYLRLPPNPNPIKISVTDPIAITVYYPNEIKNDGVGSQQSKVLTADKMVVKYGMNVIDINDKNDANVTAVYTFAAQGTSVKYTLIFKYKAPKEASGGGLFDKIKNLGSNIITGLFHMIMDSIKSVGRIVLGFLPFLTGEETMIYFTLLPTDNMLGSAGNVIKDFYYKTSLPWGMVILLALSMLSGIDRLWNGEDDIAFKLTKDIIGTIIWMFGGYYFYMAFAGFINTIIMDIGIDYILRMGYYIDLLMGLLILYAGITIVISDNASGTYVGMIMFVIGMFQAIAFMRFFLIAAAVALYPILAPWGLLPKYGVGSRQIISGIVKQGIYGILIAGLLRIVFTLADQGGALGVGAMLLPIAFLLSPQLMQNVVGAIESGSFSHGTAMSLASSVKGSIQRAGLAATGAIGGKIAAHRAKKFETHVPESPAEKFTIIGDVEPPEAPEETYIGGGYEEEEEERRPPRRGRRGGGGGAARKTYTGGRATRETHVGGGSEEESKEEGETALVGAMATTESTTKEKESTVRIGSAKVRTKDKELAEFMKVHAYHAEKLPTSLHRAAYFRYYAKQLEEMSKPSWQRFIEGFKERNVRKIVGAGASMVASGILRFNQYAASAMDAGIVSSAGLDKQNRLIAEAYRKRHTYRAASEAFRKLAEIEERKYITQHSEELKKLAERYGGDEQKVIEALKDRALAQIPLFLEYQPKKYMSNIGKHIAQLAAPKTEKLFKGIKASRMTEEYLEHIPGMVEDHVKTLAELKEKGVKIRVTPPKINPARLNIKPVIEKLPARIDIRQYQKNLSTIIADKIKANVHKSYTQVVSEEIARKTVEEMRSEIVKEVEKHVSVIQDAIERIGRNLR